MDDNFPSIGELHWIGLSPNSRADILSVETAEAKVGTGLVGDHHAEHSQGRSQREVTLIQSEHLPIVASLLSRDAISPELLRRNLVVRGINLLALEGKTFRIGDVTLEGTGPCEPCQRMRQNLGPGGYNAMVGHGGITARVVNGGTIRIGDSVEVCLTDSPTTE